MPNSKELNSAFFEQLILQPREAPMTVVAEAFRRDIQDGRIDRTCSMLQALNKAIEESGYHQENMKKLRNLGLLDIIPFIDRDKQIETCCLLTSKRIPIVTGALLLILDMLTNMSKASLLGKRQLGMFVPDLMQSVVADEEMGFAPRLEAVRLVNSYLRECEVENVKDDSPEVYRAFSKIKGKSRQLLVSAGDYELQGGMVEMIFRLTPVPERQTFAAVNFTTNPEVQMFVDISDGNFEAGCRHFLNALNTNFERGRSVFSFPCKSVFFGDDEVQQPKYDALEEFWVDFNFGSKSITLFVWDESVTGDSQKDSEWETVIIESENVQDYRIRECEEDVHILLKFNTPVSVIIDFLPKNQNRYANICFEKSHDPSSVVERILGPSKKKSVSCKDDSELNSTPTKASVAIHSIHLNSRASGVTEVVPTANVRLPPVIMAEDSDEDNFEKVASQGADNEDIPQNEICIEEAAAAAEHEVEHAQQEQAEEGETDGTKDLQVKAEGCGVENGRLHDKDENAVDQDEITLSLDHSASELTSQSLPPASNNVSDASRNSPIVRIGRTNSAQDAKSANNQEQNGTGSEAAVRRSERLGSKTGLPHVAVETDECDDEGSSDPKQPSAKGKKRQTKLTPVNSADADRSAVERRRLIKSAPSNSRVTFAERVALENLSSSDDDKENVSEADEVDTRNEEPRERAARSSKGRNERLTQRSDHETSQSDRSSNGRDEHVTARSDHSSKRSRTRKREKSPLHLKISKGTQKGSSTDNNTEDEHGESGPTQRKHPSAFNVSGRLEAARRRRSTGEVRDEPLSRKALKEKVFLRGPSALTPEEAIESQKRKTGGKLDYLYPARARFCPKSGKKRVVTPSKPLAVRGKMHRREQRKENQRFSSHSENDGATAVESTDDDVIEIIQDSCPITDGHENERHLSTILEETENSVEDLNANAEGSPTGRPRTRSHQRKAADGGGAGLLTSTLKKDNEVSARGKGKRAASRASVSPGLSAIVEETTKEMLTPGKAIPLNSIVDDHAGSGYNSRDEQQNLWDPADIGDYRDGTVPQHESPNRNEDIIGLGELQTPDADVDEKKSEEEDGESQGEAMNLGRIKENLESLESTEVQSGNKRASKNKQPSNKRPKTGKENNEPNKRDATEGFDSDDEDTESYLEEGDDVAVKTKKQSTKDAGNTKELEGFDDRGEEEEEVYERARDEEERSRCSHTRRVQARSSSSAKRVYPTRKRKEAATSLPARNTRRPAEPVETNDDEIELHHIPQDIDDDFKQRNLAKTQARGQRRRVRKGFSETASGGFGSGIKKRYRRRVEIDRGYTSNENYDDESQDEWADSRLGTTTFTPPRSHQRKAGHALTLSERFGRLSTSKERSTSKRFATHLDDSGLGVTPGTEQPKRRRSAETTTPKNLRKLDRLEITITAEPDVMVSDPDEFEEDEKILERRRHQFVDWSKSGPSNTESKQRSVRTKRTTGRNETRTKRFHCSLTPDVDYGGGGGGGSGGGGGGGGGGSDSGDDEGETSDLLYVKPKRLFPKETPVSRRVDREVEATDEDTADLEIKRDVRGLVNSLGSDFILATRRKRKILKQFAQNTVETTFNTMNSLWNSQQTARTNMVEEYKSKFGRHLDALETDMEKTRKVEEKFLTSVHQQTKSLGNQRVAMENRVQNIHNMQLSFEDEMSNIDRKERERQASIREQVRENTTQIQRNFLEVMEKDGRENLRKSMQTMLARSFCG